LVFIRVEYDSGDGKAEHGHDYGNRLWEGSIGGGYDNLHQTLACWKGRAPKHGRDGV
jgi:hypothetical protein